MKTTIVDLVASAASLLLSYNRQLYQERRLVVLREVEKETAYGGKTVVVKRAKRREDRDSHRPWGCNT